MLCCLRRRVGASSARHSCYLSGAPDLCAATWRGYSAALPPAAAACLLGEAGPARIASLPGRGRGLVATRDITRGEIVLTEVPLISVPAAVETPTTADADVDDATVAATQLASDTAADWRVREAVSGVTRTSTEQLDLDLEAGASVVAAAAATGPQQFPRIAMRALLLLQETPEIWEELKHLCSPRLEARWKHCIPCASA